MFPPDHWTQMRHRRFMIGLHMPDYDQLPRKDWTKMPAILENMDPRGLVLSLKKARVEMFYYYAKCHYGNAYYPSQTPGAHVHSALKGRDLFREFTDACLAADIVPGAVYEFSDHRLKQDHPDWCHCNAPHSEKGVVDITDEVQGATIAGGCLNGPYGDYALAQTLEVIRNYPIQAYYVDFLGLFGSFHAWVCPFCNARFKREFGMVFPGTARLTRKQLIAYRDWRYRQYDEYARKMRAAIRAERPDVVFTHNFFGISDEPGQCRWDLAQANCDFMTKDVFSLRLGSLPIAWRTRALRECSPKAPAEILLDTITCLSGDWFTPKPRDAYRAEAWTARCAGLAHCGSLLPTLDGDTAGVVRPVLGLMADIFNEQQAMEPWLQGMQPLAETAILRSRQAIENPLPGTGIEGLEHAHEFYGWCEVLGAAHHLWTVIQDHHLTDSNLARFHTLVLPHATCLDAAQCAAIGKFVRGGGSLIATGATSLFDGAGRPRRDFALAEVLGVKYLRPAAPDLSLLRLNDLKLLPDAPWRQPYLIINAGQLLVLPRGAARILGSVVRRECETMTTFLTQLPNPGLAEHRYGRGRTWYCAAGFGRQYYKYGQYNLKHLMRGLLARAQGARARLALEAVESVDLQAHTQAGAPDRLVVSLINQISSLTKTQGAADKGRKHDMIDVMPVVAEARLTIRPPRGRQIRRVMLLPDRRPLKIEPGNVLRLHNLDVLTMLAVEFEKRT